MAVGAYLRRRWRLVGLMLVLLAGSTLAGLTTDRGHEPLWLVDVGEVAVVAASPDGATGYALVHEGDGTVGSLAAMRDGAVAWRVDVPGSPSLAFLEASADVVAVATEAPTVEEPAHLLVVDATDGSVLLSVEFATSARALAVDGRNVAVAVVDAPQHPVRVWRGLDAPVNVTTGGRVMSLALEGSTLAVGLMADTTGNAGRLLVVENLSDVVLDVPRDHAVLQVRLDDVGRRVAAGGVRSLSSGVVEGFDLDDPVPEVPQWQRELTGSAAHVATARDARRVLALVTPPGQHSEVHVVEPGEAGPTTWGIRADGVIRRESTSTAAAVALSPDGDRVAFGTLSGPLVLYAVGGDAPAWSFRAEATHGVAFAADAPERFVAALDLGSSKGGHRVGLFDVHAEPLVHDMRLVLPAAWATILLVGGALLGVGFVRAPTRPGI